MKHLSLILVALTALYLLASCGTKTTVGEEDATSVSQVSDNEPESETKSDRIQPELPDDAHFDGQDFAYLHWLVSSWGMTGTDDIVSEEETGEPVDDAVFRRNNAISEKYGVKFSVVYQECADLLNTYRNTVQGDLQSYDVVIPMLNTMTKPITDGNCYDLNQLPYVDFTKPWWDQMSASDLTINGKLYMIASDIIITEDQATAAFLFNKQMAVNYKLPDMYALVESGGWTLDALAEFSKGVSDDIDGNSVMDSNDLYGILGQHDFALAAFNGAGSKFAAKDEDDLPYDSFNNERNIAVCKKILDIMYNENLFFNAHLNNMDQTWDMFAENKGLFRWTILGHVITMRQSDTDFGILPTPKYDEAQEKYYNMVNPYNCGLITVPANCADPEMTGIILEALSAESKYTLRPAYYDITLKGKSSRDNESEAMLDLIIDNRIYDCGAIYNFADFSNQWLYLTKSGDTDVVSFHEKYSKRISKAIDDLVEQIEKLG